MFALRPCTLLLFAFIPLGLVGCAPDPLVFGSRAWVGEHLEVWTTEDVTVCGGSFEALDRHAEVITEFADELGVNTRSASYRYYWVQPEDLNGVICEPGDAPACFSLRNDAVYTTRFHPHEIVHAEFASRHSSFVDEGLATMLGGNRLAFIPNSSSVPSVVDDTAGGALAGEHYNLAAKFVRASAELYPDSFLRPLLETRRSDDFDALSRQIGDAFDINDVLALHDGAEFCGMDAARVALFECNMDPIPWSGTTWSTSGQVDCSSPDVLGPNPDNEVWVIRPFKIDQAGGYTVRFEGDAIVQLVSCENPFCESGFGYYEVNFSVPGNTTFLAPNADHPIAFLAGKHWFRVLRFLDDEEKIGAYNLTIRPGWP